MRKSHEKKTDWNKKVTLHSLRHVGNLFATPKIDLRQMGVVQCRFRCVCLDEVSHHEGDQVSGHFWCDIEVFANISRMGVTNEENTRKWNVYHPLLIIIKISTRWLFNS